MALTFGDGCEAGVSTLGSGTGGDAVGASTLGSGAGGSTMALRSSVEGVDAGLGWGGSFV